MELALNVLLNAHQRLIIQGLTKKVTVDKGYGVVYYDFKEI